MTDALKVIGNQDVLQDMIANAQNQSTVTFRDKSDLPQK